MNRGSDATRADQRDAYLASMRPRFMNRGSGHPSSGSESARQRFNEAPIHESGKYLVALTHPERNRASMRPRFMNRGSPAFSTAAVPAS